MSSQLTNEKISKRFVSLFELVNHTIKVAENMIHTGRGPRVRNTSQNTALLAIHEVEDGKEVLEDLPEKYEEETYSFDTRKPTPANLDIIEEDDEDEEETLEESVEESVVE